MNDRKTELGDKDFLALANKKKKVEILFMLLCAKLFVNDSWTTSYYNMYVIIYFYWNF